MVKNVTLKFSVTITRILWNLWPCRLEQELAVRLDFNIPSTEKDFLEKRKVVVGQALHKLLCLSSPLKTDRVRCGSQFKYWSLIEKKKKIS